MSTLPPDRKPTAKVPAMLGNHATRLLRELAVDPFTQSALMRLYADAPRHLDPVTRLRITAALTADRTEQENQTDD